MVVIRPEYRSKVLPESQKRRKNNDSDSKTKTFFNVFPKNQNDSFSNDFLTLFHVTFFENEKKLIQDLFVANSDQRHDEAHGPILIPYIRLHVNLTY